MQLWYDLTAFSQIYFGTFGVLLILIGTLVGTSITHLFVYCVYRNEPGSYQFHIYLILVLVPHLWYLVDYTINPGGVGLILLGIVIGAGVTYWRHSCGMGIRIKTSPHDRPPQ